MILVTGAAGKTGQAVILALAARGAPVRAFVKRQEQAETVKVWGADQVIAGDMENANTMERAAQGVTAIYHICPNMHPAEIAIGQVVIAAAKAAGVARFGYHSVLHPQTPSMPHHWNKLGVEALLFESGLPFTILQPAVYMQNILSQKEAILKSGIYEVPYDPGCRMSLLDVADLAQAVAVVMTEPGHEGAIYELSGPDILTQFDVATILGDALDSPIQVRQIPIPEWTERARLAVGMSDYKIETLVKMFRYYDKYGFWGNANALTTLLGRRPSTFRETVERFVRA